MRLERQFDVRALRKTVVDAVNRGEAFLDLFPNTRVEVIKSEGNERTVLAHYAALGQERTATLHFTFQDDGGISFSKLCDGRIWKSLTGAVTFEAIGFGTRVRIAYEGATKSLVPEFTIRGPMQHQVDQTANALRSLIGSAV